MNGAAIGLFGVWGATDWGDGLGNGLGRRLGRRYEGKCLYFLSAPAGDSVGR